MSKSTWSTVATVMLLIPWSLVIAGVLYAYHRRPR